MIQVDRIDHLVLTVRDIDTSVAFYQRVMGMEKQLFGDDRTALIFGNQKINLHCLGNEFEPKAENAKTGSADLCFITSSSLDDAIAHIKSCGIEIITGPVERTGALGKINSVYLRDPDGNLIEISNYQTARKQI